MDPGVSALAVARTKVVAEPRIAPGDGHVGWLESTDGRTELVVVPADGSGPPVTGTTTSDPARVTTATRASSTQHHPPPR